MLENEKTKKIILLYGVAFLSCILAIIMFFSPFVVTLRKTIYAVPPGGSRKEISTDSNEVSKNFFEYIDYLEYQNWTPTQENRLLTFVVLSFIVAVGLLLATYFIFLKKVIPLSKEIAIALLVFSLITFISMVLAISVQSDVNVWKVCGTKVVYLPEYVGWKFHEETEVRGTPKLIPTAFLLLVAFLAQCIAGFQILQEWKTIGKQTENSIEKNSFENNQTHK